MPRYGQPPSSTGPSCGCSNGYHGTNSAGACSSAQRSTASACSSVGPTYQKSVDCFVPVAASTTSQNSVVHENTPRCSYAQSSAAPLMVTVLSHVKSSNTACTG